MLTTFRPYQPDQSLLLPPSLKDWLPEDHLAYFISETVDRLDLSAFYRDYEGDGRRNCPFDPQMMVKILLYGYATGIRSSRKIAKKLHEDVAFRVLAAGNFPAHRTIAEFRQLHLKEFEALFVQVVQLAQEIGVLKLGTLAIDGSKVKANASKHKAMSYGRMKEEEERVREEIGKLLEQAVAVDAEEDRLYGEEKRGDELPEELRGREERLAKIEAAQRSLEERQAAEDRAKGRREGDERKSRRGGRRFKREFGVPEDKAQENFTDPDSRIMESREGFIQAYNTQIAVDENTQLIVATGLTECAADNGELLPLVEEVERIAGQVPERVLADAGYKGETNLEQLEQKGIDAYVSLARERKKPSSRPDERYPASQRMYDKLQSSTGRMNYRKRKGIVEPVYGWIKEILGFRRFSLRAVEKVTPEWDLVCCATNLKRLHALFAWI
ncbi:IS1182 family transposase, partial [Acidobacteria bacterium AH-259-A15]|nr:IS1182 family transposase [Acidobacteria bacterium AH-259-A15]